MTKITRVLCRRCGHNGFVADEAAKVSSFIEAMVDTSFPCRNCDGQYSRYYEELDHQGSASASFKVSVDDMWRSLLGPESERPGSADAVITKMKGQTIVDVDGVVEDGRVVINKLVLGDGTTVWLGTAGQNSVVYRMKEGQHDGTGQGSEAGQ